MTTKTEGDREKRRERYLKNRQRAIQYQKEYRKRNKEQTKKYYLENRAKILNRQNKYNRNNNEIRLGKLRESYKRSSKKVIDKVLKRIRDYPEKHIARGKAWYHIEIPKGKICQICREKRARDRHHIDYTKPLEVLFLCRSCHRKEHIKLKEMEAISK